MLAAHDTYQQQVQSWRDELTVLGEKLQAAQTPDQVEAVAVAVRDLRVRARKVCDELGIFTDGTESLHKLIRQILGKIE